MSNATTKKEQTQTDLAVPVQADERGLQFTDFEQLVRFSNALYQSGFAPKDFKNPQACMIAIQMGRELGLTPMAAVQNIAVINGRPTIWGDASLGVCQASSVFDHQAFKEWWSEDGKTAYCQVARVGDDEPITREYTMKDAEQNQLLGKDNWKKNPKRMLQLRARAFALRDKFSDLLKGFRIEGDGYEEIPAPGGRVEVSQIPEEPPQAGSAALVDQLKGKPHLRAPEPATVDMSTGEVLNTGDNVEMFKR